MDVPADAAKEAVMELAAADAAVAENLAGKTVVKEIYVPGKLLNIVVR